MASRLCGHNGQPPWPAATFRQAGGITQVVRPEAVTFEPLCNWASPRTVIGYPVEWRVRIGPRLFQLQPPMDDQELDGGRSTGAVYWEGAVRVAEDGHEVRRGCLGMTGYGERIRVG